MSGPLLLQVKGLSKRFGGFVALDGIDLDVAEGERLGLIGPNGSGKSTLVNCICGTLQNETGTVSFNGQFDQRLPGPQAHAPGARAQLPAAAAVRQHDGGRQRARAAALHRAAPHRARALGAGDLDQRCMELLALVGLEHLAGRWPRDLTQVEMRKLELARAVASEPKLLIADEAMAGLSHSEVEDIVQLLLRLNAQGITVILIEHIMRAVMAFSQRIAVLVSGRKIADGKPDEIVNNPEVVSAYLGQ